MVYFDQILHTYACQHYLTTCMSKSLVYGRGLAEHHFSQYWSVRKMLISLEPQSKFGSNCTLIYFNIVLSLVCMQNGDEALPIIILAGHGLLVKMLITLEPHHIFESNFAYLYILTLSKHLCTKRWQDCAEDKSGISWSDAHNFWITWYSSIKFCTPIHFNVI